MYSLVSLNAFNGHRYISFILALENEDGDYNYNDDLGRFELSDTIETRFSPNCINMVENTNTNPKTHMHLTWVAPTNPESGCVLIRATVLQHREVWHMDDGGLTRRICPETTDDVESQPSATSVEAPCCACDEARYEVSLSYSMIPVISVSSIFKANLRERLVAKSPSEVFSCSYLGDTIL